MSEKKPSAIANLILLVLVLTVLGAVGGGGFWAYKKFFKGQGKEVVGGATTTDQGATVAAGDPIDDGATVAAGDPIDDGATVAAGDPIDDGATVATGDPIDDTTGSADAASGETAAKVPDPGEIDANATEVAAEPVAGEPEVNDMPERATDPELLAFSPESPEGRALLADALRRVDEAPGKTAQEKALAEKGLRQAKQLGKIATVYFNTSGARLTPAESARLDKALQDSSIKTMTENAKAVCFVLGFADKTGSDEYNKRLSMSRAQNVIKALQAKGLKLGPTPVAIGTSELVDKENQGKNRAAEVWIVVP